MKTKSFLMLWVVLVVVATAGSGVAQSIIYGTPQSQVGYNSDMEFSFDISIRGGSPEFTMVSGIIEPGLLTAGITTFGSNNVVTTSTGPYGEHTPGLFWVTAFVAGDLIGPALDLGNAWYDKNADLYGRAMIGTGGFTVSSSESYFLNSSPADPDFTRFIGFDLYYDDSHHYGWMRVANPFPSFFLVGEVVDWAYESTPNTPIEAGAVPEPGTVALWGIGAVGLLAGRRLRRVAA